LVLKKALHETYLFSFLQRTQTNQFTLKFGVDS
jgi:hypothetical protein